MEKINKWYQPISSFLLFLLSQDKMFPQFMAAFLGWMWALSRGLCSGALSIDDFQGWVRSHVIVWTGRMCQSNKANLFPRLYRLSCLLNRSRSPHCFIFLKINLLEVADYLSLAYYFLYSSEKWILNIIGSIALSYEGRQSLIN